MIQLKSLSLQRGKNLLLDHADLSVHAGQKVGIIGANGAGKSSLFKLLLGELEADTGSLELPRDWQVAHMAQEVSVEDRAAIEYVLDGDAELRQLEGQLADAEAKDEPLRLATLYSEYESIGGYQARSRAEQLLHGLGFTQPECSRPVQSFSGGWRIRLNLAQALMCRSDLLLLDEPTNHLDLDATLWLEQWLKQYAGTLLLISHDRDFLDQVVSYIAHIERAEIHYYRGNYSAFERMRAEKLAQQQAAFTKQQERKAQIEDFVRRFKAKASKAKQAQSRLKELERMEEIAPAHVDSPFDFSFQGEQKMSNPLLNLQEACLGYGETEILTKISLNLQPQMRIGLLGANGAGKSTLIKSLLGHTPLLSGQRTEGENLRIGYFAQHQLESLDLQASAALHLQRLNPQATDQQIRTFLGGFNFHGDQALDPVEQFSGGEKARLALAILAWQRPNLLLMDEPTNHLDLEVRHALTLALQAFPGALILVSHDRHLLRNCVDEFWLVHDGKVDEFDGDLDDYSRWLTDTERENRELSDAVDTVEQKATDTTVESAQQRKERKRLEAEQRQKLAPLRKQLAKLEKQIDQFQEQLEELETLLADTTLYEDAAKERLKQTLQQQARIEKQMAETEEAWMQASEELEQLSV